MLLLDMLLAISTQLCHDAGTPGQCGSACIDLSQYPFMNTNACICNSPSVGQIAVSAKAARHDYMIAIIGRPLSPRPLISKFSPGSASAGNL